MKFEAFHPNLIEAAVVEYIIVPDINLTVDNFDHHTLRLSLGHPLIWKSYGPVQQGFIKMKTSYRQQATNGIEENIYSKVLHSNVCAIYRTAQTRFEK